MSDSPQTPLQEAISIANIILEQEFGKEQIKPRGPYTREVGDSLTTIEIEMKKSFKLITEGMNILDIYPHLKIESQEDAA